MAAGSLRVAPEKRTESWMTYQAIRQHAQQGSHHDEHNGDDGDLAAGMDGYVSKPFRFEELTQAISDVVRNAKPGERLEVQNAGLEGPPSAAGRRRRPTRPPR